MDLNHAVPFSPPTRIWAGDYADCAGAAVTVITAGAAQKPGETRLDLVKKNTAHLQQIMPRSPQPNPDGIIVVATNPVDVLSYVAWKISGLPPRASSAPARSSTRPASATCSASTSASIRAACTPTSSASTATARCRSGRRPTSPACA